MRKRNRGRPGPGWKHIAGPVFEHLSGARIHLSGHIRLPCGDWMSLSNIRDWKEIDAAIRINGGSVRRGLMAAAARRAESSAQLFED